MCWLEKSLAEHGSNHAAYFDSQKLPALQNWQLFHLIQH